MAAAALPLAVLAQGPDPATGAAASRGDAPSSALALPNQPGSSRTGDASEQQAPDPAPDPGAEEVEQTLASFLSGRERILLQGAQAQADINLPLPLRWEPRALTLKLQYRNSVSLVRARSQLRVVLNGLIIAQFALDPERPEGEARIRLPLDLLQSGYNQLSFAVAQHTEERTCEDPKAPELWTQIDAQTSTLSLTYRRLPLVNSLADLSAFADRHRWGQARLRILMPLEQGQARAEQLRWGALVAQAAAI
ncbi:cellulose biosynthesis cyclic di-GMP-binding regulatory protein BcsB, partial [Halochromatium sp.]